MINNLFYNHLLCLRFANTYDHNIVNVTKTKSVNFSGADHMISLSLVVFSLHLLGSQRVAMRKTNVSSPKLFSSPSLHGSKPPSSFPVFSFLFSFWSLPFLYFSVRWHFVSWSSNSFRKIQRFQGYRWTPKSQAIQFRFPFNFLPLLQSGPVIKQDFRQSFHSLIGPPQQSGSIIFSPSWKLMHCVWGGGLDFTASFPT